MIFHNVVRCVVLFSFALTLGLYNSQATASACAEFEAEAEAFDGVVPRFDEAGKVRAILMYGESSFLTPKRSLIANARRTAELNARRAYAEFLKSNFDSDTVASNLIETQQVTDVDGNTSGTATELASTLNSMRQSAQAILSGIVKLDECVNREEKYILVQLGWKPSTSTAAADAKQTMNEDVARGERAVQGSSQNTNTLDSVGKKAGIELISLEVEGRGINLRSATNEALKSAVSQIFGEKFAAQSSVAESVQSASISAMSGTTGVALETSSTSNSVQSETSGLIRSWSYIEQIDGSDGYKVLLSVVIPKYKSSLDSSKSTIIVIEPISGSDTIIQDQLFKDFASKIHSVLEEKLAQTAGLNVLDRQYLNLAAQEIGTISRSGNIEELAKLGNQAGGDLMLIPVIEKFKYSIDKREIGKQVIERTVYSVTLSTKVIEVATSNIVDAKNFPIRNKKIKSEEPTIDMALFMAERALRHLSKAVGGGYADGSAEVNKRQPDMKALKEASEKSFKEAKENVKDDW
jgi:hypothetical protein